jgi:L-lactate dehydrogenase complex protein LldF
VPGPIGSILSPNLDLKKYSSLPFASTLCGSCTDVCPVNINIHEQLFKWRQVIAENGHQPLMNKLSMKAMGMLFKHPALFRFSGKIGRAMLGIMPRFMISNGLNIWGKARELPKAPKESFHDWYLKNRKDAK